MYVNQAHNIYIKMSLKSELSAIYIVTMSLVIKHKCYWKNLQIQYLGFSA